MARYVATKLLVMLPVLLLVSAAVFLVARMAPGDPVTLVVGLQAPPEVRREAARALNLDKPLPVQFVTFLGDSLRGDFGRSYVLGRTVSSLMRERFANTLLLGLTAFLVSYLLAVPLGILAAARHGSAIDHLAVAFGNLGLAVPGFLVGLILIYVFGLRLHWFPTAGYDSLAHMVLPVATLAFGGLAITLRMVRAAVLEELTADYVRTARSKGLAETRVVLRHVLRNALIPIISISALRLGLLMGGAVVVEVVFGWPGVGRLLVDAVGARDYPVIQAVTLVLATSVMVTNLVADILYAAVNPRIRY